MVDVQARSADELDFLPARYRHQHTGRRATVRCVAAAVGCAVVLVALFLVQRHERSRLEAERAIVAAQHQFAVAQTKQLAQLRAKMATLNDQARLYTYLRHPWPRTAMIDTIARSAPDSVVLTEIEISRTQPKIGRTSTQRSPAAPSEPLQGVAADLQQLRTDYDNTRVMVTVEGITYDAGQFHSLFMGRLNRARLFQSSKLLSVKHDKSLPVGASRFRVELMTRLGYGQMRGPRGDLALVGMTRSEDVGARQPATGAPVIRRPSGTANIDGGATWNN